jgi:hypothetical protein
MVASGADVGRARIPWSGTVFAELIGLEIDDSAPPNRAMVGFGTRVAMGAFDRVSSTTRAGSELCRRPERVDRMEAIGGRGSLIAPRQGRRKSCVAPPFAAEAASP